MENINRRKFLSTTAKLGLAGAVTPAFLTSCTSKKEPALTPLRQEGDYYVPELPDKAIEGKELKVGVVGCGGRGSGAVNDLLDAADGIKVTALGDTFIDRLSDLRGNLAKRGQEIADENCFVGFDAYQKVIDSGVDMVILATPPVFRAEHFRYATEKGVHSFLEKPIAVDAKGYRTIIAAARQAQAKGLSVVTGTQRHHQREYVEAFQKIQEGIIGDIVSGNVYWNQGMLWYKERQAGWSDMEWMIRDWVNWKWLSGDHIVEQHVHNIDVFLWMSGMRPIKATGVGSLNDDQVVVPGAQPDFLAMGDAGFPVGVRMKDMELVMVMVVVLALDGIADDAFQLSALETDDRSLVHQIGAGAVQCHGIRAAGDAQVGNDGSVIVVPAVAFR